jgi:hypothetical protein
MQTTNRTQGAITRNDLIAFKSATDAAPTTQMQVIRLFEKLQSNIANIGAIVTTPSKNVECGRKGGHTINAKAICKSHFCIECGAEVLSSAELRQEPVAEAPTKKHQTLTRYWVHEGNAALAR